MDYGIFFQRIRSSPRSRSISARVQGISQCLDDWILVGVQIWQSTTICHKSSRTSTFSIYFFSDFCLDFAYHGSQLHLLASVLYVFFVRINNIQQVSVVDVLFFLKFCQSGVCHGFFSNMLPSIYNNSGSNVQMLAIFCHKQVQVLNKKRCRSPLGIECRAFIESAHFSKSIWNARTIWFRVPSNKFPVFPLERIFSCKLDGFVRICMYCHGHLGTFPPIN